MPLMAFKPVQIKVTEDNIIVRNLKIIKHN